MAASSHHHLYHPNTTCSLSRVRRHHRHLHGRRLLLPPTPRPVTALPSPSAACRPSSSRTAFTRGGPGGNGGYWIGESSFSLVWGGDFKNGLPPGVLLGEKDPIRPPVDFLDHVNIISLLNGHIELPDHADGYLELRDLDFPYADAYVELHDLDFPYADGYMELPDNADGYVELCDLDFPYADGYMELPDHADEYVELHDLDFQYADGYMDLPDHADDGYIQLHDHADEYVQLRDLDFPYADGYIELSDLADEYAEMHDVEDFLYADGCIELPDRADGDLKLHDLDFPYADGYHELLDLVFPYADDGLDVLPYASDDLDIFSYANNYLDLNVRTDSGSSSGDEDDEGPAEWLGRENGDEPNEDAP